MGKTLIDVLVVRRGAIFRVRGLVTLGTTAAVLLMFAQGKRPEPELLTTWVGLMTFYLATRAQEGD